jgi:hypothetical protein
MRCGALAHCREIQRHAAEWRTASSPRPAPPAVAVARCGALLHSDPHRISLTSRERSVSDPVDPHPMSRAFIQAAGEARPARSLRTGARVLITALQAGFRVLDDYNGEEQLGASLLWRARALSAPVPAHLASTGPAGAGLVQCTMRDGVRENTASAYLRPAEARGNVDILTNAHVCKCVSALASEAGSRHERAALAGSSLTRTSAPTALSTRREVRRLVTPRPSWLWLTHHGGRPGLEGGGDSLQEGDHLVGRRHRFSADPHAERSRPQGAGATARPRHQPHLHAC